MCSNERDKLSNREWNLPAGKAGMTEAKAPIDGNQEVSRGGGVCMGPEGG